MLFALFSCCLLINGIFVLGLKAPKFEIPHRGCYLIGETIQDLSGNGFKLSDLKPTLCTYVVYGFSTIIDNELQITPRDEENMRLLGLLRKIDSSLNVFLGLNSIDHKVMNHLENAFIYTGNRSDFVTTVVEKLRIWQLDGLLVHIESLSPSSAPLMSLLIKDVHARFHQEEGLQTYRLALGLHVGHSSKQSKIDPAIIASLADLVEVHTYDYTAPEIQPSPTGHNAPLYITSIPGILPNTVEFSMTDWEAAGVPKSRLVIGLPLYGQSWSLIKTRRFESGAPAMGPSPAAGYSNMEGRLFFHDICERLRNETLVRVFDTDTMVPYAHDNETIWVSYDDADSCRIKARWVLEKGYGGVFFYDISMEDYSGSCGKESFMVLQGVAEVFATARTVDFQEKRECDRKFCLSRGVGVHALGSCATAYCSCDFGGKAFRFPCGPQTIFDPLILACNYASAVKGCENAE